MATTNHERVGKAMDLLRSGLVPFVERELTNAYQSRAQARAVEFLSETHRPPKDPLKQWDASALLKLMWNGWHDVFGNTLGRSERTLVSELREHRNSWAHQHTFSSDDAYRALDSVNRLLAAVSAPQAGDVEKMKMELLRVRFDGHRRSEQRKSAGSAVESAATGTLKPWREVVTPHPDVASGRYHQAEFAADLWQVHVGEGQDEYKNPVEFYRRTYLTDSLRRLLVGALQRLGGQGSAPVVDLQTNFGGGKTHSMLALYHLFSGVPPAELAGIDAVMQEAGAETLPQVKRVVLVGNKISPGNPVIKPDGTPVRTLWGELAWQLGGKDAFRRVQADDEKATSPGDVLRELLNEHAPSLILIDEWVAYARQLHERSDLPAGSFETQFTFAQTLTEAAKAARHCLLVISLPASDSGASQYARADDAEVGGQRGREALERLRNVVGRLESTWRPASAEESFEIVRRRLFEPLADPDRFKERDVVARAFADLYRKQHQEFPAECGNADYEQRICAAYPIHPEIFDRLYSDWSTLEKFQRTRGVLRLMAAVIHGLWEKADRNPLIQPANIPIDDSRVQFELTRYLPDTWTPIIEKDVDGHGSTPLKLDAEVPNLGKSMAGRRVARTIYLGSAPTPASANRGLEDRRVKLGCVMPGESPAVFGDALRRLAAAATYLYQDGTRYWYDTRPTVTKLAEERAAEFQRDQDKVLSELAQRLDANLRERGDFRGVHQLPASGADVPDATDARLVVLPLEQAYAKQSDSSAEATARAILETRGPTPRLYRNTLVFLAADSARRQDLDEALCKYLAWESILGDQETLDLSLHQVKQAKAQQESADRTVVARLPETYKWLLVPVQERPDAVLRWEPIRLAGQGPLAVRASKKLRDDEQLVTSLAASRLRLELDRVPLWRGGDHVAVKQLVEDFARYPYLPRLRDANVLLDAIRGGIGLLTWQQDAFASAEGYDEAARRYRGLRGGQAVAPSGDDAGLLVRAEVARKQMDAEAAPLGHAVDVQPDVRETDDTRPAAAGSLPSPDTPPGSVQPPRPKRYHGTVPLDPTRAGFDASKIADEVITHLAALMGSKVRVTLEIDADIPAGAPEHVVRAVTENGRTLKFTSHGFEDE